MAAAPPDAPISPDGHYWWNGQEWVPIAQPPPAPAGPPISPDGHYWWNGEQWLPLPRPQVVTAPNPVAVAAAPVAPVAPVEEPPTWLAAPPPAVAPSPPQETVYEPAPAAAYAVAPPAVPGSNLRIYGTALLVVIVLGVGGFAVRQQLLASQNSAAVVPSPTPSPLLSQYERADRFLNVDMGPPLTETTSALTQAQAKCTSALPPACQDALLALDKGMRDTDAVMSSADVPPCIGPQLKQFQVDWQGMEQGVAMAIGGYEQNNRTLIVTGLQKFASIAQFIKPDIDRINKAEPLCPK